jgi:thiamine biosynthesis lipoprotein
MLRPPTPARRTFTLAALIVSAALTSWSCAHTSGKSTSSRRHGQPEGPKLERHEFDQSGVGVDFRVVLYCADAAAARRAQAVVATRLDKLAELLDRSRPHSEVAQLEENAGLGSVHVSGEFYDLIRSLDRLAQHSNGAFDITAGAAAAQWKQASASAGELPRDGDVARVRKLTGIDKLHLDAVNRTISLAEAGMTLEVDDVVAAYGCDCILEALQLAGFPIALVDAGRASSGRAGCILVGGAPPGQPGWRIVVDDADPRVPEHKVTLTRHAIVSSGRLSEIVQIAGNEYAPLVDPRTGIGSRNIATVTVVAPHAWLAAGIARGAAILGEADGRGFIRATPGTIGWFHYPAGATRPTIAPPAATTQPFIVPGQPAPFLRPRGSGTRGRR